MGSRPLRSGQRGWDVAALQFALGVKGFACGPVDGDFGPRVTAAVQRLQRYAGLRADGVAGPATMAVVHRPPPATPPLRAPINAPVGDRYGPRGNGFHAGLDFPAPSGATVRSAAPGRVTFASFASGWGLVVTVDHGGFKTRYAHLSRATVAVGESVSAGERVGLVGATGVATGPHLHFEVVVRGANVNPAHGL
ncbi:peptidoglycan DD-metalloendopeptidase family protein [Solirubrobacter phytolaccae]|uniref:Peptidoglycan DD-metalloendopeptidase family protein n=1 Tax=Solirubrobacter phytolaccae TaxID=1404360 RepID=A0A9X3SD62_9ACTN|nr:peptidoglycan DD-metalloendopeptidase family protein [Solirubrobacter phytolaccae]